MMNMLEEAIVYATIMHQGKVRKFGGRPFILHPMEVAQILSTMTDDMEVITAGILHDVVEDTDGTLDEIQKRFGERVARLVDSESEDEFPGEDVSATWQRRKEGSLLLLRRSRDTGVKMLWLADKLANLRSLSQTYSEQGEAMWSGLHQGDPERQLWYYKSVAEALELSLNRTGAFKELVKHINFIWPGTFDSGKGRYKRYKEVSVDGCQLIGRGAKGEVYRYDEELVIKVFNQNNLYQDVERETSLARRAFILGVPTAISFGIVAVGERYGAMYELVDSETLSAQIAREPGEVDRYAKLLSDVAHQIHGIEVSEDDIFPEAYGRVVEYVRGGVAYEDEALASRCMRLVGSLPAANTLIHGDFHTNNVFMMKGEPLLIDMDRVSRGHPIVELADLYYFYVVLGQDDPSIVENFMGFSYETSKRLWDTFLRCYLATDDEARLAEVTDKASLLCQTRMIRKVRRSGTRSNEGRAIIDRCLARIDELTRRLETLEF
ncbi:MAG: HD domain-containing protein [Coriobacteriales bacterium]|nr:HD domain-containing protein [Coriobacteriales bacterium]